MTCSRVYTLCAAWCVILAACSGAGADHGRERRDSVAARLEREHFVLDSLSRLVNTDSLYHLREAIRIRHDTAAVFQATLCEVAQLQWRYGSIPAERAIKRMQDSVWRGVTREARRQLESYPGRPIGGAITTECERGARAPERVDGVSLFLDPNGTSAPSRHDTIDASKGQT